VSSVASSGTANESHLSSSSAKYLPVDCQERSGGMSTDTLPGTSEARGVSCACDRPSGLRGSCDSAVLVAVWSLVPHALADAHCWDPPVGSSAATQRGGPLRAGGGHRQMHGRGRTSDSACSPDGAPKSTAPLGPAAAPHSSASTVLDGKRVWASLAIRTRLAALSEHVLQPE